MDLLTSKTIMFNQYWNKQKVRLSPSDVECMTVFLTCSSHKEWKKLDLHECFIHDHGVHILHHRLKSCDVTITLLLWSNGLTKRSYSAIGDITISHRVKMLNISDNKTVGADKRLYSIISDPSSMLEELYMGPLTYHVIQQLNCLLPLVGYYGLTTVTSVMKLVMRLLWQ